MTRYNQEVRERVTMRMMPPSNEPLARVAKETGISEMTLHKWRKQSRESGYAAPGNGLEAERWSSQDKFLIVMETATLNEMEIADYCRRRGLYVEQVKEWKQACQQANGELSKQTGSLQKELRQEKRRVQMLEKELRRKEKALAETAALLTLRKKLQAIWGDDGDA